MVTKSTKPPHFGNVQNRINFNSAYQNALNNPLSIYRTRGNQTAFEVEAKIRVKGKNKGKKVLVVKSNGYEYACAYSCCWGHIINCNRTYIDCYTSML